MRIFTITLGYCRFEVLEMAIARHRATAVLPTKHVLVDHHWPRDYWANRHRILSLAEANNLKVMSPYENLGGHGGHSWVLRNLPLTPEDFVVLYDSDSNPISHAWDTAMLDVLKADPTVGAVFLMQNGALGAQGRTWTDESIGGHVVTFPNPYSVQNVTMLSYKFIQALGSTIGGLRPFYGYAENCMREVADKNGMRMGYLKEFWEEPSTVPQDDEYTTWKIQHAHLNQFPGNFDAFLKRNEPK